MSELNREQIIKALERLVEKYSVSGSFNTYVTLCDALSLIKELAEENEGLRLIQLHVCVGDVITPENKEELRAVAGHNDPVGEPGECGLKRTCIADTVGKMQSEIKDRCIKGGIYPAFVASTIDQIAKEMMEEEK